MATEIGVNLVVDYENLGPVGQPMVNSHVSNAGYNSHRGRLPDLSGEAKELQLVCPCRKSWWVAMG